MKNTWKKIIAAFFTVSLLTTTPGAAAHAAIPADVDITESCNKIQNENAADIPEEDVVSLESGFITETVVPSIEDVTHPEISEDPAEVIDFSEADTPDLEEPEDAAEKTDLPGYYDLPSENMSNEESVGTSTYQVGSGVTATFDSDTGSIVLKTTTGGTLWRNWLEKIGIERYKIKSLTVESVSGSYPANRKVKLPANSSGYTSYDNAVLGDLYNAAYIDLRGFDTSNVTNMVYMFQNCRKVTSLDLSGFDTSKVTVMHDMFYGCENLTTLNLSSFNTANVTSIGGLFEECKKLKYVDLGDLDMSKVTNAVSMFQECNPLNILITPKNLKTNDECFLPGTMYDRNGKKYDKLPVNTGSMVLGRTKEMAASIFIDVRDPSHPYYNAIYWAVEKGITKGYPDGTFGIDKPCTRGEMVMFLWRYAGKPAPKAVSKSPFKDVPSSHAFYNAILWAYQKGITKGYSDGTFGINRNVSRGESMMFLWRLKGKPEPTPVSASPFKDVPKTHAFYKAILWGYQKKITTGYTSGPKKGTFGINENCTRGQIVTFLYRAK